MLRALVKLHTEVVSLPDKSTPTSDHISNNPKFGPYFSNCLGALDGTHVDMHLPPKDQPRYRNRKQGLSQNVLAVCDFGMEFTYILPG